jgi:hypothetical protein
MRPHMRLMLAAFATLHLTLAAGETAWAFDIEATPLHWTGATAVAYNPDADQFLVVWQSSGGVIMGQIRSGDTTTVVRELPNMVGLPPLTDRFKRPRVTYKTNQRLYILTYEREHLRATIPGVPAVPGLTGIEVRAYTDTGTFRWAREVGEAAIVERRNPDVVADTFGTRCCILVAWEDGHDVKAQQLDGDGTLHGPVKVIWAGSGSQPIMNPAVTYKRAGDDFLVVAQRVGSGNRVVAKLVQPEEGSVGTEIVVSDLEETPRPLLGERFAAGVAVAFQPVTGEFLVAWHDVNSVFARRLGGTALPVGSRLDLGRVTAPDRPAVAAGAGRELLVTYGDSAAVFNWVAGDTVVDGVLGAGTVGPLLRHLPRATALAYGATARLYLVAWEQPEPSGAFADIRGEQRASSP